MAAALDQLDAHKDLSIGISTEQAGRSAPAWT